MPQKIRIIGVPMDLGASRRGVDMGPSALRVAGLQARIKQLGHQVEDIGNISVKQPEEMPYGEKRAKYIEEIADACKDLGTAVQKSLEDGYMPLVLGGDHSIAVGSVSGVGAHFRTEKKSIGCIWLDAHSDMNTPETSPSGNVHGMPLSALLGYGTEELYDLFGYKPKIEPQNVALVGVRDLDSHEKKFIKKLGVKAFTMREIDERGMREVMSDALKYAMDDTDGVVVSLDGNDRGQRNHGVHGNCRDQPRHRRAQPNGAAWCGTCSLGPRQEDPVSRQQFRSVDAIGLPI